ncbi:MULTISPECIES: response regulator transcription factor [Burkholderia]|jgi:DNA-binding response OmpR family regulator|uniref:Response regulator transcription factor n=1 Tax=Burkholderia contaminans TaxID=488447 RepID=A0ABD7Y6R7_9BURK|nr:MULTISPECIES: response regulator transcription factor [Burkholderia]MCA7908886.1 response regulator transcription factor [Burkholderia contaminans]MCA8185521.1 response regulator transcription factor [Burkholderia contaminans]MCA8364105.1 response regulator transcription factor [Burkholderia contaminans]MCQ4557283.1 response regulator transcription factor [Burkholderia contaminans]MDE4932368.1 response regulator transcription factor [Burkholderia contaminans]
MLTACNPASRRHGRLKSRRLQIAGECGANDGCVAPSRAARPSIAAETKARRRNYTTRIEGSGMAKVLLLDDEVELREEIAAFLEKRGWTVDQAGTVAEFQARASDLAFAIIDVMLPDGSGFDAAVWLRARHRDCGIVMLTARGETQDKIDGLIGGADHYLVKPVKLLELDAILQALGRRVAHDWRLDCQARVLTAPAGGRLDLSASEIALLSLLARHPSKAVSRRQIAEDFGFDWVDYDERRLETMVSRLRQRWRSEAGSELPLKTVHRTGYTFAVPLMLA